MQVTREPVRKRPRDLEHIQQKYLFDWVRMASAKEPALRKLYAIPNGGQRHAAVAAKLKAEGVKSGVWDLHLPVARGSAIGLWVEMKVKGNYLTENQKEWRELMTEEGHVCVVCYGWHEAKEAIEAYLAGTINHEERHR